MSLDAKIAELAKKYLPIGIEILKEAIRIPADHVHQGNIIFFSPSIQTQTPPNIKTYHSIPNNKISLH
jgi:hypothetical protein